MSTYNDELTAEVERVTLKGNADKHTMKKLASIIWRLDQRIQELEGTAEPAPIEVEETVAVVEEKPTRRIAAKKKD